MDQLLDLRVLDDAVQAFEGSVVETPARRPRMIFAGCVRNGARTLASVLANIDRLAARCRAAHVILAENDSTDGSLLLLQTWARDRSDVTLLAPKDLDRRFPERTDRLCHIRNLCLEAVAAQGLTDFDAYTVLDFDDENAAPIDTAGFERAVAFLFGASDIAGVFATSSPVYYDIYALRHERWCPTDCWREIAALPSARRAEGYRELVRDRQVPIAADHAPIAVDSAFGGLGIYRMSYAAQARYSAREADGSPVCEHVLFNRMIRALGGRLFVHPALRNHTPWQHVLGNLANKQITINGRAGAIVLLASAQHRLEADHASGPLYGRRLPIMMAALAERIAKPRLLDLGSDILDTLALVRTHVTALDAVCAERSLEAYQYAAFNQQANAAAFGPIDLRWADGGRCPEAGDATPDGEAPRPPLDILAPSRMSFATLAPGGADVVRTALDGADPVALSRNLDWLRAVKPIIWTRARVRTPTDLEAWAGLLEALDDDYPLLLAFDNFGFCVASGAARRRRSTLLDLLRIACRYERHQTTHGAARLSFFDLALFPASHAATYVALTAALDELRDEEL